MNARVEFADPVTDDIAPRADDRKAAPTQKVDTGYIGKSEARPNAKRLLQGRGVFVDDLRLPRLAHVVYFRSPYAQLSGYVHRMKRPKKSGGRS